MTSITPVGPGPASGGPPSEVASARLRSHSGSLTEPQWERAVAAAITGIRSGQLKKVVLARDLLVTGTAPINTTALLKRLTARDSDCYVFACAGLVGATPELLIHREGGQVRSRVIASTAGRGGGPSEDRRRRAALLASAKDGQEHRYAVESVNHVLARFCDHLAADDAPSLIRLADMYHLATTITGTLTVDASVLTLAGSLHPTAAVCGTPASSAMDLIRELEDMDRPRYAGPVGWMPVATNGVSRCTAVKSTAGPPGYSLGMQAFWLRLTPPLATIPDAAEIVVTGPSTRARATVTVHRAGS
jgi:menaquinone-specific isochorismate synthase